MFVSVLQQAIDKSTLEIPPGATGLPETLRTGNTAGGKYVGHGQTQSLSPRHPTANGSSSQLYYQGEDGHPVILVEGTEKYFSDFTVHPDKHDRSNWWEADGRKPSCAFELRQNKDPNLGGGDHIFERITVAGFDVGFLLGDYHLIKEQCDESTFRNINFQNCRIGFQFGHLQAIGHNFEVIKWRNGQENGKVFNIQGGGKILVGDVQCATSASATCLYLDPADQHQYGQNCSQFIFGQVRADRASKHRFMMFDSNPDTIGSSFSQIVIQGGGPQSEAYPDNDARLGVLYGNQHAYLSNISQLQIGHFGWHSTPQAIPSLTIRDSIFAPSSNVKCVSEVLAATGNTGHVYLRAFNNKNFNGKLPDIHDGSGGPVLFDPDGTRSCICAK